MLSIKGLHCAVGSPEALVQPRDMAEGDGFMFVFFFSGSLQQVEETQRAEFRFDCNRVLFTCDGKKRSY